jgi:hypothetical protein
MRYVLGMRVRNQITADFCVGCTSEAVSSQHDYYGAASRSVLVLVRKDGAFV